jgi:hypothetical protein
VKAAALSLLTSVALILLTAVSVSAEANPANHGHHYGQLKHQAAPPPPVPAPVPPPAQITPPPATTVQPPPVSMPAPAKTSNAGIVAAVVPPAMKILPASQQPLVVKAVKALPQHDPLWWLLLLLAATLAVLWLFVYVQLARIGVKRRLAQVN